MNTKAIILSGHGARDVRWREPFDRLALLWQAQHHQVRVALAFLELMRPSLEEAVASHVLAGAIEVVIVPIFFGQGRHLRNDFPLLLDICRKRFPNIALSAVPAVGEDEATLQAIIDYGARIL